MGKMIFYKAEGGRKADPKRKKARKAQRVARRKERRNRK